MPIYTLDLNQEMLPAPEGHQIGEVIPPAEISKESLTVKGVEWMFLLDQDIVRMQEGFNLDFHSVWRQAFQFYIDGNWSLAYDLLRKCSAMRVQAGCPDGDGPAQCLLLFMVSCWDCRSPTRLRTLVQVYASTANYQLILNLILSYSPMNIVLNCAYCGTHKYHTYTGTSLITIDKIRDQID